MEPREKALELVSKFFNNDFKNTYGFNLAELEAKQCALIAVDLAIEYNDFHIEYLQEVKNEINKL